MAIRYPKVGREGPANESQRSSENGKSVRSPADS